MTAPDGGEPLDFSTAPPTGSAAPTCAACHQTLTDQYWTIGRTVVCAPCRDRIEAVESAAKYRRFGRAVLFGAGGMVAGALVWYGVEKVFNLEIGLIAILLGYLVGKAIRRGADNRGGLRYQILAVVLTYLGISLAYTPFLVEGVITQIRHERTVATMAPSDSSKGAAPGSQAPKSGAASSDAKPLTLRDYLVAIGGLVFVILSLPVRVVTGSAGGFISLIIYGIAFLQAWNLTAGVPLTASGPFRVGAGPTPA